MNKRKLITAGLLALGLGLGVVPAYAHGFGERYDLPIPLNYFLVGAGATVALSFLVIGLFVRGGSSGFRYPRYNLLAVPVVDEANHLLGIVTVDDVVDVMEE